jgi:hypothetical protein
MRSSHSPWTSQRGSHALCGGVTRVIARSLAVASAALLVSACTAESPERSPTGTAYLGLEAHQTRLKPDPALADRFGAAVSASADTIVVGAIDHTSSRGAAYVFERAGPAWTQADLLEAPDAVNSDGFGRAVAVDDDGLAPGEDSGGGGRAGLHGPDGPARLTHDVRAGRMPRSCVVGWAGRIDAGRGAARARCGRSSPRPRRRCSSRAAASKIR